MPTHSSHVEFCEPPGSNKEENSAIISFSRVNYVRKTHDIQDQYKPTQNNELYEKLHCAFL
jgi:hypothetical protein